MIFITLLYIDKTQALKKVDQQAIRPINQVFYDDRDEDDDDEDSDEDSNVGQIVTVANFNDASLTKITEESRFQSIFALYEKTLRIIVIILLICFILYIIYICFPFQKNDKEYKSVE